MGIPPLFLSFGKLPLLVPGNQNGKSFQGTFPVYVL
jgi:hypothetical protein